MLLAPIALFVYKRLQTTQKIIEALKANVYAPESELFIFSDGPKNESDIDKVQQVRAYIKTISDFKSVNIVERKENLGLSESIITGVTEIVNRYGKVIVLEDDIITSKYFLKFMNEALNMYETEENVASISAYFPPIENNLPQTFFMRWADCWGWATWKRGWDLFERDGKKLLKKIEEQKLSQEFDFNGTYPYKKMLKKQIKGKIDSWAIKWYASVFLDNKLTLCPSESLVYNIGFDKDATHCSSTFSEKIMINLNPVHLKKIPVEASKEAFLIMKQYFFSKRKNFFCINLFKKLINKWKYGYFGNYSSWQEAEKYSTGYSSDLILEKVKKSLLKVKNGEAVYERDSVLFNKKEYSWPLLAALLWIASRNNNKLNLIDFGGSLGSSYFQNKEFLSHLKELSWSIVEQPGFVQCGKKYFEDDVLKFYSSVEICLENEKSDAIIFSSVIQYLEKPYDLLNKVLSKNFKYIIIDRTLFSNNGKDILAVQKVPPAIYPASYPAWIFSERKFLELFNDKYELISDFKALAGKVKLHNSKIKFAEDKGYIFVKKGVQHENDS